MTSAPAAARPLILLVDDVDDNRPMYAEFLDTAERRAWDAGADAFLTKPCMPEDLAAKIAAMLASRAAE